MQVEWAGVKRYKILAVGRFWFPLPFFHLILSAFLVDIENREVKRI